MADKLRLSLEHLQVESFVPVSFQPGLNGTVHGFVRETMSCLATGCWQQCGSGFCETTDCETQDPGACYTNNPEWGTCRPVYTCPECASPPETTTADPVACTSAEIG
jgi:hypothetical protein